jgi:hypothetical protein
MGQPSGEQKWFDSTGKVIRSEKYPSLPLLAPDVSKSK